MERITISLEPGLAEDFESLIRTRGYTNRSEAVRDILRSQIEASRQARDEGTHCVASLSYVFNHHERELTERLTHLQHEHHDLCVSTMHSHLDHQFCLETLLLKGPTAAVRRLADALITERGVRNGQLNLITVEVDGAGRGTRYVRTGLAHSHAPGGHGQPAHEHAHPHVHLKPRG